MGRELRSERCPHVTGLSVTMKEYDRRTFAPDAHVNGGAVGGDLLGAKASRVRWDLCSRGPCDRKKSGDDQSKHEVPPIYLSMGIGKLRQIGQQRLKFGRRREDRARGIHRALDLLGR